MSNKRNNHRNGRKAKGRQHWLHPTKGYRRERTDARAGYATIKAFTLRAFVPAEALKPWEGSRRFHEIAAGETNG